MPKDKTPGEIIQNVKPSIRELIWLARCRQSSLFDAELPSDSRLSAVEDCNEADCLPWHHSRSECVELRRRRSEQTNTNEETPVL
jgi:hypothetical protein